VSSIRLRLLAGLAGPIVFVNLAAAALAYLLAWAPAGLAFDAALQEAARAAAHDPQAVAHPARRADGAELTWVAVRADGRLLAGAPGLPTALPEGAVGDASLDGEPVRHTSVRALVDGQPAVLTLARTVRQRRQVRAAMLRGLVLLESVCSLALVGLIWVSVTNGLAPLARLRASLDRRDSVNLAPLPEQDMGHELQPVAAAFNALLERIAEATRTQREFQANVAHQLRTPLAGARLQLEWLAERHRDDSDTAAAVARLLDTNERLTRETNQLLALARAEPSQTGRARLAPLDLARLVGDGVQSFVERAAARDIDLGFALAPATIDGDVFLLRDLLDNLVDNALRYTPPGGSVTVRCGGAAAGAPPGGAVLEVEDDGPGIAPAQRARVFERFVRLAPEGAATGSGLGLAIVRDIARLHGARVELGEGAAGKGARFTIHFPARRA
jgi:two-component system sensor histidine kinase TctE